MSIISNKRQNVCGPLNESNNFPPFSNKVANKENCSPKKNKSNSNNRHWVVKAKVSKENYLDNQIKSINQNHQNHQNNHNLLNVVKKESNLEIKKYRVSAVPLNSNSDSKVGIKQLVQKIDYHLDHQPKNLKMNEIDFVNRCYSLECEFDTKWLK